MPRRPAFTPHALDVASFCRDGARLQGQRPLSDLARLAEGVLPGSDAAVDWAASGSMGRAGGALRARLHLRISSTVALQCQRCLQPMLQALEVERDFDFVEGEDEAARLDEEEPESDVLALEPRFDLHRLVEDELLLALPIVPRHGICPELPAQLLPAADAGDSALPGAAATDHPFAALAALRRKT